MTRRPAFLSACAHRRGVLAAAVLAALALSGCGGETSSGTGAQGEPGSRSVGTEASPASPSAEQAAFAALLDEVARSCASIDAEPGPTDDAPRPTDKKPTGAPAGRQSLAPGQTPPAGPVEPGAPTGPEAEATDREWCAGLHHEQRITRALQSVPEPTPAKVRTVLNGLGYPDEHIHALEQDGEVTRFYIDLPDSSGRVCEPSVAAAEATEVTVCSAPDERPRS
jgi:hypothetical protein